jgi:hypothetical protein
MKKSITIILMGLILSSSITGCSNLNLLGPSYKKVSELSTMDVLKTLKKGQTTMEDVKKEFGPPSKENIITLSEAKTMFAAKNTGGNIFNEWLQTYKKVASIQAKIIRNYKGKDDSLDKETKIDENKKVVLWIYNDYEESSSLFNPLNVKRKGARLLIIFDPDTQKLIDYKFQKYDD